MKRQTKSVNVCFRIDPVMAELARKHCTKHELQMSDLLRQAVYAYLARVGA